MCGIYGDIYIGQPVVHCVYFVNNRKNVREPVHLHANIKRKKCVNDTHNKTTLVLLIIMLRKSRNVFKIYL